MEESAEHISTKQKIKAYEKSGMWSHAAELADKHAERIKDKRLKTRALENYEKHLNQTLIRELKTIKIIRNIIFYLLCFWDYRLMALFIRMAQKAVEEMIQGQRSFRRFSFF